DYKSGNPIFLFTDVSLVGIGAWIGQGPIINQACLAAFHSRKLSSTQQNYPVYDLELLAIVDALQSFKPFLLGTHFTIITDHKNLKSFKTKSLSVLSPCQVRWLIKISPFDFNILYTPGKKNILADA